MTTRYDARGLICPLPVLKVRKLLSTRAPGDILEVETDDPVARIDLPHFCAEAGHRHLGISDLGAAPLHRIERG